MHKPSLSYLVQRAVIGDVRRFERVIAGRGRRCGKKFGLGTGFGVARNFPERIRLEENARLQTVVRLSGEKDVGPRCTRHLQRLAVGGDGSVGIDEYPERMADGEFSETLIHVERPSRRALFRGAVELVGIETDGEGQRPRFRRGQTARENASWIACEKFTRIAHAVHGEINFGERFVERKRARISIGRPEREIDAKAPRGRKSHSPSPRRTPDPVEIAADEQRIVGELYALRSDASEDARSEPAASYRQRLVLPAGVRIIRRTVEQQPMTGRRFL